MVTLFSLSYFFFFNDTATTEIYTLSLHDALPICQGYMTENIWDRGNGRRLQAECSRSLQIRDCRLSKKADDGLPPSSAIYRPASAVLRIRLVKHRRS